MTQRTRRGVLGIAGMLAGLWPYSAVSSGQYDNEAGAGTVQTQGMTCAEPQYADTQWATGDLSLQSCPGADMATVVVKADEVAKSLDTPPEHRTGQVRVFLDAGMSRTVYFRGEVTISCSNHDIDFSIANRADAIAQTHEGQGPPDDESGETGDGTSSETSTGDESEQAGAGDDTESTRTETTDQNSSSQNGAQEQETTTESSGNGSENGSTGGGATVDPGTPDDLSSAEPAEAEAVAVSPAAWTDE